MLDSEQIHDSLNNLGFIMESGKQKPSYAYEHYLGNGQYLYVKRKEGSSVSKAPLVIPPGFAYQRSSINQINGIRVQWDAPRKSSSYREYPKHNGNGTK